MVKVAYLLNQYPKISHTFVRREIAALAEEGIAVLRYSIRPAPEALIDARDQAEAGQTRVLLAGSKVGLKLNLPKASLEAVVKALPSLRNPTVSPLTNPEWVALETIVDESVVRVFIPQLKALGAEGIVEYPLNKVVY